MADIVAWNDLSRHRPYYGDGVEGPIPLAVIRDHAALEGLTAQETRELARRIAILDEEYLAHRAEERKQEMQRVTQRAGR